MNSIPWNETITQLRRRAHIREEELFNAENGLAFDLRSEREVGAAVDEHSDTWGFSWMPAIEEFVEQAAARAEVDGHDDTLEPDDREKNDSSWGKEGQGEGNSRADKNLVVGGRNRRNDFTTMSGSGRKRRRPGGGEGAFCSPPRQRAAPRLPSYNEVLLADKSFHNPHACETMADAFGIVRPASFVLDVRTDDRSRGATTAMPSARAEASVEAGYDEDAQKAAGGDRGWFYDTVRDRQNRLWANGRVKKGVELARKGQHQAAIDTYTQALGMCPDHDDGLVARGAAYTTIGRLHQAVKDLSRALSVNPQNENAKSYLRETRRRMERQDARDQSGFATKGGRVGALDKGGSTTELAGHNGKDRGGPSSGGPISLRGNEGTDELSKSALAALLQDGARGEALQKVKALLEQDEKKRKRERKSIGTVGGGGDGGDSGADGGADGGTSDFRRKKSHKKGKKSKNKRSSSRRHSKSHRERDRDRDRDRRKSTGAIGGDASSSGDSSSSSSSSSSAEGDVRSKKRKRRHKHKKRSRARSNSPSASAAGSYRNGIEQPVGYDSGADESHPILQRKKHSLWG